MIVYSCVSMWVFADMSKEALTKKEEYESSSNHQ